MSFESRLDKILSEAPPATQPAVRHPNPQRYSLRKKGPVAKQGPDPGFASVRKSLRRPMVAMDAAIHKIDQLLNTSQQDPSQLGDLVTQIEQSFNAIFNPLKAVRSGVADLRKAADTFNAEYVGQKPAAAAPQQDQGAAQQGEAPVDEDRFLNRIATEVELSNRQEDKMAAAKQGFEAYKQQGGKMNRGEYFRRLVQKLRLPGEGQPEEEQRKLPNIGSSKRYGPTGTRTGELQFKPGRTSPVESSAQRRKLIKEGPYKHYNLGQLQQAEPVDENRLLNKIATNVEMVNNPADKQSAFRNGWIEYQEAGGQMDYNSFATALTQKLGAGQA
jgi:hypothetical protein